MEQELAGLQGDFAELKRESFRASLAGPGSELKAPKPFLTSTSPSGSSIIARLQALKRESAQLLESSSTRGATDLPPSSAPAAAQASNPSQGRVLQPITRENARSSTAAERSSFSEICFEAAGQWETPSLAQAAEELFSDSTFAELCERGLTMQLKRTKDGATAETRIAELAGLVKLLRRCLTQMSTRTRSFIETCVKFEKEARQQVESLELARDSAAANHKRELAAAQRDAAQVAAQHKSAAASWHTDLDTYKSELSCLKRELERMESERDRAREEARLAVASRSELESMAQGVKRETGQQLRELQVDHGAAMRQLAAVQEASERAQARLQAEVGAAQEAKEAAAARAAAVEEQLSSVQQRLDQAVEALEATRSKEQDLVVHHKQLSSDYLAQLARCEAAEADCAALRRDCGASQERSAALAAECDARAAALEAASQRLQEAHAAQASSSQAWESERASLQGARDAALEREAQLAAEKAQLKSGLGTALEQKALVESQLAAAHSEQHSLRSQVEAAEARGKQGQAEAQAAMAELAEVRSQAQVEAAAHEALMHDASQKAARLARLEGTALQPCTPCTTILY
ncbi:hypothetical protein COCSUDRAFT_61657 [Coccomyxa subellipsoidea C-169]|uniref:Uncharacterized protein n=1 Tax=Coccomyxa subellipsoidea (strain C-169) TaxID=574566 RepID=I0Z471_COCSC|nr:hypothetical protein COCSUDRAFT_61657 [Coccomyxa subellipsoidea C-169]EIE25440.1 hypothetical protein COCSUDRAFT_61657 [Coccomyxa subellipsoidea C-169]|eukprot:XP_005649984.1 hypothetical protein COCSUDRAFT_61657 [Coccomyxa subellipsoidea C-169]